MKILFILMTVLQLFTVTAGDKFSSVAQNPSEAIYLGVLGNSHKIELNSKVEADLSRRNGKVLLIDNRTGSSVMITFFFRNYNAEQVEYEFITTNDELHYFVIESSDTTFNASIIHGVVEERADRYVYNEGFIYQCTDQTTLQAQEGTMVAKAGMIISNPIEVATKILVEFSSQDSKFNDAVLDNYYNADTSFQMLNEYQKPLRYFYFEISAWN
ncbi:hypothetical protein [Spirochaeta dissipatitropha]